MGESYWRYVVWQNGGAYLLSLSSRKKAKISGEKGERLKKTRRDSVLKKREGGRGRFVGENFWGNPELLLTKLVIVA
jgi:hypothetical protein